jgi:hypothetical protein
MSSYWNNLQDYATQIRNYLATATPTIIGASAGAGVGGPVGALVGGCVGDQLGKRINPAKSADKTTEEEVKESVIKDHAVKIWGLNETIEGLKKENIRLTNVVVKLEKSNRRMVNTVACIVSIASVTILFYSAKLAFNIYKPEIVP